VQGTAFHLLLWCLIQLNKRRKERGWKSRILWQIHDSIVWNLHPEEREAIVRACYHIMTKVAPAHFPWINTPIKVEPEITDIDGTFYDLKTYDEDSYETA
jgi:DNA polymerase I-like protein with 3'-5' exonuclease and polymerase domains